MSGDDARPCPSCGGAPEADRRYRTLDLVRCRDCGLVYTARVNIGEMAEKYASDEYTDANAEYFEDDLSFEHQAAVRVERVRSRLSTGRLIELGPGSGHFLAAADSAGFDVLGIEPSPALAERISRRFGVPVQSSTVEQALLDDDSADVICLFHVLEHLEDPVGTMRALGRVLKPGGLLFVEVPNVDSAMARRRGEQWVAIRPERMHLTQFSPRTLPPLLERAGVAVLEAQTVSPWLYIPPARRIALRPLLGYGYRALKLRTPAHTHPTGFDNLWVLATVGEEA